MDPASLLIGLLIGALVAAVLLVALVLALVGGVIGFLSREEDPDVGDEIGDAFPHQLDPLTP